MARSLMVACGVCFVGGVCSFVVDPGGMCMCVVSWMVYIALREGDPGRTTEPPPPPPFVKPLRGFYVSRVSGIPKGLVL